jgi:hypothetical protein
MKRTVLSIALVLTLGLSHASDSVPENTGSKNAPDTAKIEFALISPGEGRYLFFINEDMPEKNTATFKWSPKTDSAVLLVKSGDTVLEEITVKNADCIRLSLNKHSAHRTLTWSLTVGNSDAVMQGDIKLMKYRPMYIYEM